jgi:ATP-dependent exoDNAse (exonuclease V) beta subunit
VGQTRVSCTLYEPKRTWARLSPKIASEVKDSGPLPPPLLAAVAPLEEQVDQRTADSDQRPSLQVWRVVSVVERPEAPAWVVGALVHEALAAWRFPEDGFEGWVEARARGHGLADERQLRDAARQTRKLLQRFQEHPLCKEMEDAERRLNEVPYSRVVGGQVENGIIDALYLRDGAWTIVEFKTDEVRDQAALDDLLAEERYVDQVHRYQAALENLLGQRPRAILCLLDYARGVRVLDEEELASG